MGIDQVDHDTMAQGLVSEQQKRKLDSRQRASQTPQERQQEKVLGRIMKRQPGTTVQDTEIANKQAAMKRRSSDHRTARGQIQMHGSVDQSVR